MMQITCAFELKNETRRAHESSASSKDFFMLKYLELQTYMIFFKKQSAG